MKYCKRCKEQVTTHISFYSNGMAKIVCNDCLSDLSEYDYDDTDYYEAGFMNDFGDSN